MSNDTDSTRTDRKRNDDRDAGPDHDADLPLGEGYVQFEPATSQAFRDLVQETLGGSDFIKTEWIGEQLVITEVGQFDDCL